MEHGTRCEIELHNIIIKNSKIVGFDTNFKEAHLIDMDKYLLSRLLLDNSKEMLEEKV